MMQFSLHFSCKFVKDTFFLLIAVYVSSLHLRSGLVLIHFHAAHWDPTHGQSLPRACLHTPCLALVILYPTFVMWKVTQNDSSGTDTCKVCLSSCKKYGQTGHLNDVEKSRGAHDNSGFQNDEKDPRDKLW